MPSLVGTMSALARTTCVLTHYVRTKKEKKERMEYKMITNVFIPFEVDLFVDLYKRLKYLKGY